MAKFETSEEGVKLLGDHGFPHGIARKGDVPNLAEIAGKRIGSHVFGVTREGAAAALRLLADRLDSGAILPQEMVDATKAVVDDFTFRTLTFTFAERHETEDGQGTGR